MASGKKITGKLIAIVGISDHEIVYDPLVVNDGSNSKSLRQCYWSSYLINYLGNE